MNDIAGTTTADRWFGVTRGGPPPRIIQGGMGVAVSNWRLARTVASLGQLGVISGTGIDAVFVRRLQDGDPTGAVRQAVGRFPFQDVAQEALRRFFVEGGKAADQAYRRLPLPTIDASRFHRAVTSLAAFVEVTLAREGHDGVVGMNLLTKIPLPNPATLYGAMLAGVHAVLMGAGIPRDIPAMLDELSQHHAITQRIEATVAPGGAPVEQRFDPADVFGVAAGDLPALPRPAFFPIVSSHALAEVLLKKSGASIEGFVVEAPTAGGHNAPPRGTKVFDDLGQPVYGERDRVDLQRMRDLGLPFWLAGSAGSPEALAAALAEGAAGVQVGTLFAYCDESGFTPDVKRRVIDEVRAGRATVRTDPRASPTGFPFKVVSVPGTMSEADTYAGRPRVCDLGYLREVVRGADGGVSYRCASEPVADYVAKGGDEAETVGRKCLCNALMAGVGLPQLQKGQSEPERPLVTSGDDLPSIARLLKPGANGYGARDVVAYLLGR